MSGGVKLSSSFTDAILEIPKYIVDIDQPIHQQLTSENNYYREMASSYASHSILDFLLSLRSPMFLGLDRRSKGDEDLKRFAPYRGQRQTRNIFGNSIAVSLRAAARLAEDNRKSSLIATGRIAEELQQEILLGLLHVDIDGDSPFPDLSVPSIKDIAEIENLKRLSNTLPQVLKLNKEEVSKRLTPLFDRLQSYISLIPEGKDTNSILNNSPSTEVMTALFGWSSNQTHLRRIRNLQAIVTNYNKKRAKRLDPSNKYLVLINNFLNDSGKQIVFDEDGNIGVKIVGLPGDPRDVSSLSSGEAQIFVIITQLSFNKLSSSDNVFIIDEPELSLHVDWQEMFVESIQAANPNVQFILASHSPSIILDRIDKCIDLNPARVKGKVA